MFVEKEAPLWCQETKGMAQKVNVNYSCRLVNCPCLSCKLSYSPRLFYFLRAPGGEGRWLFVMHPTSLTHWLFYYLHEGIVLSPGLGFLLRFRLPCSSDHRSACPFILQLTWELNESIFVKNKLKPKNLITAALVHSKNEMKYLFIKSSQVPTAFHLPRLLTNKEVLNFQEGILQ